ncbi:S-adenosyl-L-methionine-dependent methyltransferase [Stachybotrys elegans]|uniref:S-adenosyl-L-methionine-dependent methyltransferase n=1 Tax=Stachybotrys elegans TaxID=80388 RepID=A0A8K0SUY6_9HYPO|nr:S-adenosyl-L-methionine-dependent methyltransferase [Stachybotrys elegans]
MPRIPPSLIRRATRYSPNLAALLPACRDIPSSLNELRWLKEHVHQSGPPNTEGRLSALCRKRGRGFPLQYILGTQPFGPLDIKCKPGVLIPRPETEAYTHHLADLIKSGHALDHDGRGGDGELSIVDFCTGTGCIPLLLYSLLRQTVPRLSVYGIDISPDAVNLARENAELNRETGHLGRSQPSHTLSFQHGDLFNDADIQMLTSQPWDIMTSNPPYISNDVWEHGRGDISYSVRKYEPRLALVPRASLPLPAGWRHEDVFYSRLFDCAQLLKTRVILLEVGDEAQARRVLEGFSTHALAPVSYVELWRDSPDIDSGNQDVKSIELVKHGQQWTVPIKGSGRMRSIMIKIRQQLDCFTERRETSRIEDNV